MTQDTSAAERREQLKALYREARACERCPQLAAGRTQVVFGGGNADADILFVADAPGSREDEQGTPLVGAAGRLFDELLAAVGLARGDVFVTHALKCRPPGNRDPSAGEVKRCREYLDSQIALVRPHVICTLGNSPTRLLAPESDPIGDVHGQHKPIEVAGLHAHLLPLYHPSAALYTRGLMEELRDDVMELPALLARPVPA